MPRSVLLVLPIDLFALPWLQLDAPLTRDPRLIALPGILSGVVSLTYINHVVRIIDASRRFRRCLPFRPRTSPVRLQALRTIRLQWP